MTLARLHADWFGVQQVSFWDYDPNDQAIGFEVTCFDAIVNIRAGIATVIWVKLVDARSAKGREP